MDKQTVLKEFQTIPGVGISIAHDLWGMGYRKNADLINQDPEQMYVDICRLYKTHIDRCMLYVFRCAVYFVSHKKHDKKLLKWWNWKDERVV